VKRVPLQCGARHVGHYHAFVFRSSVCSAPRLSWFCFRAVVAGRRFDHFESRIDASDWPCCCTTGGRAGRSVWRFGTRLGHYGAVGGSCLAYIGPRGVIGRARWTFGIGARVLVGIEIVGQSVRGCYGSKHLPAIHEPWKRLTAPVAGVAIPKQPPSWTHSCCQGTEASRKEMEDESPLVLCLKTIVVVRVSCRLVLHCGNSRQGSMNIFTKWPWKSIRFCWDVEYKRVRGVLQVTRRWTRKMTSFWFWIRGFDASGFPATATTGGRTADGRTLVQYNRDASPININQRLSKLVETNKTGSKAKCWSRKGPPKKNHRRGMISLWPSFHFLWCARICGGYSITDTRMKQWRWCGCCSNERNTFSNVLDQESYQRSLLSR
jgi:hypothetical protein